MHMKKWSTLAALFLVLSLPLQVHAGKKAVPIVWTNLGATKAGEFFYDEKSLVPVPHNAKPQDIVLMEVETKVKIKDNTFLELINEGKKASKKTQWEYILMRFELNLADKTYTCTQLNLVDVQDKIKEKRKFKTKFIPVSNNTFVSKVWNVAKEKVESWQKPVSEGKVVTTEETRSDVHED